MVKTQFAPASEDFAYGAAQDAAAQKLALSIFADRAHLRSELREDAEAAGFRIAEASGFTDLGQADARPLGDVVLLDCQKVDGGVLAALARIDMRVAHAGADLVVSTNIHALDDVFGCLDQSNPQILVDPSRAERLIALGRVLARRSGGRVKELSEADRLVLLRLTEQVSQIAERMEYFGKLDGGGPSRLGNAPGQPAAASSAMPGAVSAFDFAPSRDLPYPDLDAGGDRLIRNGGQSLPEPRLVRQMIRQRQLRARFFDGGLFADPAWDMLLDLTAARAEHSRVSVTSLCIASGVPPTTALRWIGQMTEAGLLQRHEDKSDRRRAFITLTEKAADAMTRFFAQLGDAAMRMV